MTPYSELSKSALDVGKNFKAQFQTVIDKFWHSSQKSKLKGWDDWDVV
jgi:hypothetical protein